MQQIKEWTHRLKSSKTVFADNQKEDDTVSHYKHLRIEERKSIPRGKSGKEYPDDSPGRKS